LFILTIFKATKMADHSPKTFQDRKNPGEQEDARRTRNVRKRQRDQKKETEEVRGRGRKEIRKRRRQKKEKKKSMQNNT